MIYHSQCPVCGEPWVRWFGRNFTVHACAGFPQRAIPVPANDDEFEVSVPAVKSAGGLS